MQKELAKISEQYKEEKLRSKIKRDELEARIKKEREEDQRRASERRQRQQERTVQRWEEWEQERQKEEQQRRLRRQSLLQAAQDRISVRRRRNTPPSSMTLGLPGSRSSPRDSRISPRGDHTLRRSPRDRRISAGRDWALPNVEESVDKADSNDDSDSSEEDEIERWRDPTIIERTQHPSQYCPILCRETPDYVITTCSHYFDREAIQTWLSQLDSPESCPVCRKPFKIFDKKAQRKVAHRLVIQYLDLVSSQYSELWKTDRHTIIAKLWIAVDELKFQQLARVYRSDGANISEWIRVLLTEPVDAYVSRLQQAVHDVILKDLQHNLKNHIPNCYRNQLTKQITLYFAYSLTKLVPEYHVTWWRENYLPQISTKAEELFIAKYVNA